MKIVLESDNNHKVENFGKNQLTFDINEEIVFIRALIDGKDYEIDFDIDIEEFENLVQMLKVRNKHMK